jgi:hypothetical protein
MRHVKKRRHKFSVQLLDPSACPGLSLGVTDHNFKSITLVFIAGSVPMHLIHDIMTQQVSWITGGEDLSHFLEF